MVAAPTLLTPPLAPEMLATDDGVSIAYRKTPGKSPTVVFLGGFMSDMTGAKALAAEALARTRANACLCLDYRGHGASSGRFEDGTIGLWAQDALTAIDRLTEGPLVLVGSSMGAWIALLVLRARRERVRALVAIAPAPDFTEALMWPALSPEHRAELARAGVLYRPSPYGTRPTPITRALIEDGRRHLVLDAPIEFDGPVRILHGMQDPDVPWRHSLRLVACLTSADVRLTLIKDGDHRLSREQDIALLQATLDEVCAAPG